MSLEGGPMHPKKSILSESETLEFLRSNDVKPLRDWQKGQPVLYVFPQRLREDSGTLARVNHKDVPENERPTVVRVDAPSGITFDEPTQMDGTTVYQLRNEGGRSDYFVIDAATKRPRRVRTSRGEVKTYTVRGDTLFEANDSLFPPSEHEA